MNVCPACHREVFVTARSCPHCGVTQASSAIEPRLHRDACEIDWSRGSAASEFYARVGADGEAVARSPAFRWRRGVPDEDAEQVRNAHAALVRALLEDGWEPDGQGAHWFNRRFFRDVDLGVATPATSAWAQPASASPAPEAEPEVEPEVLVHAVTAVPPEPLPAAGWPAENDGLVLRLASRERAVQLISVAGLACSVLVGWRVLF